MLDCGPARLSHNVAGIDVSIEVRFFNVMALSSAVPDSNGYGSPVV